MSRVNIKELTEIPAQKAEEASMLAMAANEAIESSRFFMDLDMSINSVGMVLSEIVENNRGRKIFFMVGGKSRKLTDLLLRKLGNRLPEDNAVRILIENRVRLDDEENSIVYTRVTSRGIVDSLKARKIRNEIKEKGELLVFIDDHVVSGAKAARFLQNFNDSVFVTFSSTQEPVALYRKEGTQLLKRFFAGNTDSDILNEGLASISKLVSSYVEARLNQSFPGYGFNSIPAPFDLVDLVHQRDLRQSNELLKRIDEKIS